MSYYPDEQRPSQPELHLPPEAASVPPPPPPPPDGRRASNPVIAAAVIGAVLLIVAGIGVGLALDGDGERTSSSSGASEAESTALVQARETCAPTSDDITIGDDGYTLLIDRALAEEYPGADWTDVLCVFDELGVPDFVISQIEGTRALDGTQQAEFGECSAFWTYHPDDGLNMTITLES